ncbi:MAG TPA: thiamine pyrophosphate-dependent enzyme [Candidatus Acidoferrales bacterium]|jgi:sulfopyruvate decarboxylase subunit beta|nr:thiamine pyrophosphate-dependent enzyme [Candidatus Acidoferrales bacterium]
MKRYELLKELAKLVTDQDLVITSIGGVKPEWYSLMPSNGTMFADLLGCATPFSLGVALNLPHRRVVALDTDGGMLFNLGALCTVGKESPPNLTIIVFDNEHYEGVVGCPPTHTSGRVDLAGMASAAGIPNTATVNSLENFVQSATTMLSDNKTGLIVAKIEPGVFKDIPPERVKQSDGIEDKYRFLRHIEQLEKISIRPRYVRE